jgi:hypothetical protein
MQADSALWGIAAIPERNTLRSNQTMAPEPTDAHHDV